MNHLVFKGVLNTKNTENTVYKAKQHKYNHTYTDKISPRSSHTQTPTDSPKNAEIHTINVHIPTQSYTGYMHLHVRDRNVFHISNLIRSKSRLLEDK